MSESRANSDQGFTLIEVLLVLGLTLLILTFLYETFISSSKVTERLDREREGYREVRLTAEQMTRDLLSAWYSGSPEFPTPFTGIHQQGPDGGNLDTLSFYSFSRLHLNPDQPDSDLTRVGYALERSSENGQDNQWYHLVHEEYPNFLSGEPSEKEVLVEKVKELSFSYFDGKNWLTHWEGGKGAPAPLPLAVRARLVVINGSGEPEEWTHQVNLWEITPR